MTDLPRSAAETARRIRELTDAGADLFNVERSALLETLPFDDARAFFRADAKWIVEPNGAQQWEDFRAKTVEDVKQRIRDYLPFAWSKANKRRGLSTQRSVALFSGLLWALGKDADELRARIAGQEAAPKKVQGEAVVDLRPEWAFFGKAALVEVSEFVGFPWRDEDDDEWVESADDDPISANEALGR
jgi:hypothetical protein